MLRRRADPLVLLGDAVLVLLGALGEQHGVDIGNDTTACNGHVAQKLVELLIVSDGELNVAGHDSDLLVVAGGVASQLENLGSEVFENSSQVDWSTSTNSCCVSSVSQLAVDSAHWELQTGSVRSGLRVSRLLLGSGGGASSSSASGLWLLHGLGCGLDCCFCFRHGCLLLVELVVMMELAVLSCIRSEPTNQLADI